jgi:hypothetical protein
MQSPSSGTNTPSDLFIVLEPFRTGFADFVRALEPLCATPGDRPLLGSSDVYYRADTDIALLTIRFDREAITPQKLAWLTSVAARADLPVLDPSRLGFSDRRAFYEDYLPNYRVRVESRGGPQEALEELARLLALPDAPPPRQPSTPSARVPMPMPMPEETNRRGSHASARLTDAAEASGRYGAARSIGRGPGARSATRRGSPVAADRIAPAAVPPAPSGTPALAKATDEAAPSRPPAHRRRQGPALTSPDGSRVLRPEDAPKPPATGPAVYPVHRDRLAPGAVAPLAPAARSASSLPAGGAPPPAPATEAPVPEPAAAGPPEPPEPPVEQREAPRGKRPAFIVEDEEPPALQVRYLRGDHWVPGRLRALSLQGARLAAPAPPRAGDRVEVAIGLDHLDVMVRGEVTQVTTAAQAAVTGEPCGFALHYGPLDPATRGKLVALLKRAKQSGISLRPPPPRASVRFPVRWPAGVVTSWGELDTSALDVSRSGLFLAAGSAIGTREIVFHLPMDTSGRALAGRAEIAREVSEEMAVQRGLCRGYGVRIVDFSRNDAPRYEAFLDRVRLRTEKRIMIAAHRERGTELGRGLIAAGYAVHAGNDLAALTDSAEGGPAPDAALIDAGLLASDPNAGALKRALHARQVPCLTIADEQPDRARAVVDHLLQIT